jgi:hypothetical protein
LGTCMQLQILADCLHSSHVNILRKTAKTLVPR